MKKMYLMALAVAVLNGCSSHKEIDRQYNMDQIYNNVNHQGKRDTVSLLRQSLKVNYHLGQNDPYYPIRSPEVIVPVWNTSREHKGTGSKIGGHWEYLVVEEAQWAE